MGKQFKRNQHKPKNETIETYKQIENYIKEENDKKRDKFSFKQKKVKMPYKMYMGIKNSVLKKNKATQEYNKKNDIIAQTNNKDKFMTKYILDKYNKQEKLKKQKKLLFSRNKAKSQLKEGVLTLSKNWKDNINKK